MDLLLEKVIIYGSVALLCLVIVAIYIAKLRRTSRNTARKIDEARAAGTHEPVSLHPVVDPNNCIATGACITACPEKDILGIMGGKATPVNASRCVGHGACFHACPTQAISLCIGTEKRGVELPHVNQDFETNIPGISIAGELGGMGLIRNAVEQGRQAVEHVVRTLDRKHRAEYDLLIVGAGPAGISGSLTAKKNGLNFITLEQDTLGGTVFTFPRKKVVMTSPMVLPMHGKVKMLETNKGELLDLWQQVLTKHDIHVLEQTKAERIRPEGNHFVVSTSTGKEYSTKHILLAIGRRGTPRKLDIPGEESQKVAYRMLEPEMIRGEDIMVVGGGDSAVEAALQLCDHNRVILSYRKEAFSRIKPKNREKVQEAMDRNVLDVRFSTNLKRIEKEEVVLANGNGDELTVGQGGHGRASVHRDRDGCGHAQIEADGGPGIGRIRRGRNTQRREGGEGILEFVIGPVADDHLGQQEHALIFKTTTHDAAVFVVPEVAVGGLAVRGDGRDQHPECGEVTVRTADDVLFQHGEHVVRPFLGGHSLAIVCKLKFVTLISRVQLKADTHFSFFGIPIAKGIRE